MSHFVPWPEIIRQQNAALPTAPGANWEERVAGLERMALAMKNSSWPEGGRMLHHEAAFPKHRVKAARGRA